MLSDSVKAVSASDADLQSDMVQYERILKHLNRKDTFEDGMQIPKKHDIVFDHVSFQYSGAEQAVIRNMSFQIPSGGRVGFAGESGVGKSTILRLLLGQLEPCEGEIQYRGISIKDICKKTLYERIAYINQEAKLYNESILENLRLGNQDASMEQIENACKRACIYDYIMSLPDKFETVIGENGSLMSGGQRQRLLLAKALVRDADIYILDEVTSALDNQVEENIIASLKNNLYILDIVPHQMYDLQVFSVIPVLSFHFLSFFLFLIFICLCWVLVVAPRAFHYSEWSP